MQQLIPQKHKRSLETNINNYMSMDWISPEEMNKLLDTYNWIIEKVRAIKPKCTNNEK